jgi:hypothetical protein
MKILLGCDPELFVVNKAGAFRSAYDMIPGTKEEPYAVKDGAVQVDGCALEFNTNPAGDVLEWVSNIKSVMNDLRAMVPEEYDFAIVPSCRFNGNHFRALPDKAKELGCTPDYNAYTLAANEPPDNKTTMRTAAGHVHIGFCEGADPEDPAHIRRCATLVKQLDFYLGFSSLVWDKDTKRRAMYGKAGAFRPKPYGVEYRVLSNAWLLNEKRMEFVYNTSIRAVNDLLAGIRPFEKVSDIYLNHYINRSDEYGAKANLSKYLPDLYKELGNVA